MQRTLVFLLVLAAALPALAADTAPPVITADPLATPAPGAPLVFECRISDGSEVFEPAVFWRVAGAPEFENVALQKDGASFKALVVVPPEATGVEYFFEAFDIEGNGPARLGTRAEPLKLNFSAAAPAVTTDPIPQGDDEKEKLEATLAAQAAASALPDFKEPGTSWRKPVALGMIVAGAVLAGGGAYALISHRSQAAEFNRRFADEGRWVQADHDSINTLGTVGVALLGVGGVSLVAGGVMLAVEF